MSESSTFADIAVAISLIAQRSRLDLSHTLIVARRLGVSEMGIEIVAKERGDQIKLVEDGLQLWKQMIEIEREIRELIERRKIFARAAE